MKKCKYCQTEIDDKAKICPNCKKSQGNKLGTIIGCIIIIVIVIAISTNGNTNSSDNLSNINNTTQKQDDFTLQDGHKGYTDEYGMSYYIEGSIKNNTSKQYSYVQVTFNLYDLDGAQIGSAMSNINNLEANGLWKFKALGSIGNGKGVASYKLMEISGF